MIDEKFIRTWDPGDSHNADEIEYEKIRKLVKVEKNSIEKTIKIKTFKRLYKWKTRNISIDRIILNDNSNITSQQKILFKNLKIYQFFFF